MLFYQNCGQGFEISQAHLDGYSDLPSQINPNPVEYKGWLKENIGNPELQGAFSVTEDVLSVEGAGKDIWSTGDEFTFFYKQYNGDLEIQTRVHSLTETSAWAKVGLMIRNSLDVDSKYAMLSFHPQGKRQFHYRDTVGGETDSNNSLLSDRTDSHLKLIRQGNQISSFISVDGLMWTEVSTQTIPMNQVIFVGVALTSREEDMVTTAVLDNPTINGAQELVLVMDSDGDGIPNSQDLDDDNDGTPDELDMYPTDPTRIDDSDINPPNNSNGEMLYASACASCHDDISALQPISTKILTDKINTVNKMKHLASLTGEERSKIVGYINNYSAGNVGNDQLKFKPPYGTREFIYEKFVTIFVADTGKTSVDNSIQATISKLVRYEVSAFGGPCTQYDIMCSWGNGSILKDNYTRIDYDFISELEAKDTVAASASMLPAVNPLRKGYTLRVCEEVLSVDKAVDNALAKLSLNVNSASNDANVQNLMILFFAGRTMTPQVRASLINVYNKAKQQGMSNRDAWRFMMFSMCQSSAFEVM